MHFKNRKLTLLIGVTSLITVVATSCAVAVPLVINNANVNASTPVDLATFLKTQFGADYSTINDPFGSTPDQFSVLEKIKQDMVDGGVPASQTLSINDVESDSNWDPDGSWIIKAKPYSVQYFGTCDLHWSVSPRRQISVDLQQPTITADADIFSSKPTTPQILRKLKTIATNSNMQLNQLDCTTLTDVSTANNIVTATCYVIPQVNSVVYEPNTNNTDEVLVTLKYSLAPINLVDLITTTDLTFDDAPNEGDLWGELFRANPLLNSNGLTANDLVLNPIDFVNKVATVTAVDTNKYPGSVNISWDYTTAITLSSIFIERNLVLFIETPPTANDIWVYARNANSTYSSDEAIWNAIHNAVIIDNITGSTSGTAAMTAIDQSFRYTGSVTFNWSLDQRQNIGDLITDRNLGPMGTTPTEASIKYILNLINPGKITDWTQIGVRNITTTAGAGTAEVYVQLGSTLYNGDPIEVRYTITTNANADGSNWIGVTPGSTLAGDYTVDQTNHTISYTGLSANTFTGSDIVIPDEVCIGNEFYKVVSIGAHAFGTTISGSLTIGKNVTTINGGAFEDCTAISSIIIPDNAALNYIGNNAFTGCTSLIGTDGTDHKIAPDTSDVYYIKSGNNYYCLGQESNIDSTSSNRPAGNITIKIGTKVIANLAFSDCQLTSVDINSAVLLSIGDDTFYHCATLTSINIPDSVRLIGNEAFFLCTALSGTLTLSSALTSIGDYAFQGCASLTSIVIPDTAILSYGIGIQAFEGCTGLLGNDGGNNKIAPDANNVYYIKCNNNYYCLGKEANVDGSDINKPINNLVLKNGTKVIANAAFMDCSGLIGTLTIPASVVAINALAFSGCNYMSGDLNISSGVTYIGTAAFSYFEKNATNHGTVTFSSQLTTINEQVFQGSGFAAVILASGITDIHDSAFANCANLASISLPSSINHIGYGAFQDSPNLVSAAAADGKIFNNGDDVFYLQSGTNYYCLGQEANVDSTSSLLPTGTIAIKDDTRVIVDCAFQNCYGLTGDLDLPSTVIAIGEKAFDGAGFDGELTIDPAATIIGENAFANTNNFTSISITSTWKNYAFQDWWKFSEHDTSSLILFGHTWAITQILIDGSPL